MRITIHYTCHNCSVTFPAYCGVPYRLDNKSVDHKCTGHSIFAGSDGTMLSYICRECGHITRADATTMIPAMASRVHGCGVECDPA